MASITLKGNPIRTKGELPTVGSKAPDFKLTGGNLEDSSLASFAAMTLLAMGLVFEVPVAIMVVTSTGVVTTRQLRRSRRYAVGSCALVAALLPGDVTTMLLETVPLYLLFEIGVALAALTERRARRRAFVAA